MHNTNGGFDYVKRQSDQFPELLFDRELEESSPDALQNRMQRYSSIKCFGKTNTSGDHRMGLFESNFFQV